jgi:photosystem II stability/assembly factor-like uncharacterized protein
MKRSWAYLLVPVLCLAADGAGAAIPVTIRDINPSQSTLDPADPDGASGGRVNRLAVDPSAAANIYAASELGGLFKSTDGGQTWSHLDGHLPTRTWDVAVDPQSSNRVFATSFYDGRTASRSGISVSTDAGATWTRPASATPPSGFCRTATQRDEPAAFGISIDPADPNDVYVGTNCGLAISTDRGVTWSFVDPTPGDGGADRVSDVVVHDGSIIDVCGGDGHQRSTDGGATWATAPAVPLPGGTCALAVSPDEAYVLFAAVGTSIFESDDGGQSWPVTYVNPSPQGRIPFIETNQRAGATYDLWFGDVRLHRGTCTTPAPANPGGAQRCNASAAWAGPFTRSRGAHDDSGDIAFAAGVASDACPILFASDGGIFRNTIAASPGCHTPFWEQPTVTPHALWSWDLAGVGRAGTGPEDLYFGTQDNGSFGTTDAGAAAPAWTNERCCDGFDVAGDSVRVLNTICCFSPPPSTRLFLSSPGMVGATAEINSYPPGTLRAFQQLDSIAAFGPDDYGVITNQGVFVTGDVAAAPVVWTEIGAASSPAAACGIQVSSSGPTPVFFVKSGGCSESQQGTLWRYQGSAPGGAWQPVPAPAGGGGFGLYAVDPADPDRLIASHLGGAGGPRMVLTRNGGTTWTALPALDLAITGGGAFRFQNSSYAQPTLLAFDGTDGDLVVAGGADSGLFLSTNGGTRWERLTDPDDPVGSGSAHIPRPRYAHFDHDPPGDDVNLFVGTQGRGAWRLTFTKTPMPEIQVPGLELADACVGGGSAATLEVCNTSLGELVVDDITSSNPEVSVTPPSAGYPVRISHDFCFPFAVRFAPAAAGARAATLTVSSNDSSFPSLEIDAAAAGTVPDVRLTGSTEFGVASAWSPAEKTVSVCNTGVCDLQVTGATIDCPDFEVVHDPLPAAVSHDFCLDVPIAFRPRLPGRHRCELTVASDDPDMPSIQRTLTGRTAAFFSLHGGLAQPHGALQGVARQGSTLNLDLVYPIRPQWAWDLRLGAARLDGRGANPDTELWVLSPNLRFTVNPAGPVRLFLNGGIGAYHFDPGDFEAGADLGLGIQVPAGARFAIEATYNHHWAFTASPTLRLSQVQLGVLTSF